MAPRGARRGAIGARRPGARPSSLRRAAHGGVSLFGRLLRRSTAAALFFCSAGGGPPPGPPPPAILLLPGPPPPLAPPAIATAAPPSPLRSLRSPPSRPQEADLIRHPREAKAKSGFFVEPEEKLLFVIRIRGLNDVAPKTKKILQLLRLLKINSGVFLRVNRATLNMLQRVEPYVSYGYPNLKTVRELVLKRGFGKAGKSRVALTDNAVIEAALGKHNIICIEDLIHEIFTVGPAFKEANNFLWPFYLSSPKGGLSRKRIHFMEGGQAGNRDHFVNNLVRSMN